MSTAGSRMCSVCVCVCVCVCVFEKQKGKNKERTEVRKVSLRNGVNTSKRPQQKELSSIAPHQSEKPLTFFSV